MDFPEPNAEPTAPRRTYDLARYAVGGTPERRAGHELCRAGEQPAGIQRVDAVRVLLGGGRFRDGFGLETRAPYALAWYAVDARG